MISYLTNCLKPKEEFGASEVEWAYRQFLKRAPESTEVIQGHLKVSKNFKQLIETILASQEYKDKSTSLLKHSQTHGKVDPLNVDERLEMTSSCKDTDQIPKVADAGKVQLINGQMVQTMHEGSKVVAGGYYGEWMIRIIENLRGHHEPQEELIFHHILRHVRPGTLMVELGAFWAYYSNWYLGAVPGSTAVCVEPDKNNLECGRRNLTLNGREALLINACIGAEYLPAFTIPRESDQKTVDVPCHNLESLLEVLAGQPIELLHIDAQGAELPFLSSASGAIERGLVRFLIVSTHHESISGSPYTHQDCLQEILAMGGIILTEHSVEESFSGDGLIVASFLRSDRGICLPAFSLNRAEDSLFGPNSGSSHYKIANAKFGPMVVSERDTVISSMLLNEHQFEEDKISEVMGFLSTNFHFEPMEFVDIGANIGTHVISAMKTGRFSKGIAIEMEEKNFSLLQANVALNRLSDKTCLINTALSAKQSVAFIELCNNNFGDHRIRNSSLSAPGKYNEQSRLIKEINTTTLDNLLLSEGLSLGPSTLVWMDIQGHEGHAFAGGLETFSGRESAPYIVTEMWPYGLERADGKEPFFGFLETCCAIYDINTEGWAALPPISLAEIRNLYEKMLAFPESQKDHTDLLCIPRSSKKSPRNENA
jgi:FkbM family methyltransferase